MNDHPSRCFETDNYAIVGMSPAPLSVLAFPALCLQPVAYFVVAQEAERI